MALGVPSLLEKAARPALGLSRRRTVSGAGRSPGLPRPHLPEQARGCDLGLRPRPALYCHRLDHC